MAACKAGLLVLIAFAVFGTAASAQEVKDMDLEDSGFVMRPALTPQQLERVNLLPSHKFIARSKNGQRYFLYADPDLCKCVFVGNALAMANYQGLVSSPVTVYVQYAQSGHGSSGRLVVSGDGSWSEQHDP